MTRDEREQLHAGVKQVTNKILEKMMRRIQSGEPMTFQEMSHLTDMAKDLTYVSKNMAQSHHFEKDTPDYKL